jgi:hypothetical protein
VQSLLHFSNKDIAAFIDDDILDVSSEISREITSDFLECPVGWVRREPRTGQRKLENNITTASQINV